MSSNKDRTENRGGAQGQDREDDVHDSPMVTDEENEDQSYEDVDSSDEEAKKPPSKPHSKSKYVKGRPKGASDALKTPRPYGSIFEYGKEKMQGWQQELEEEGYEVGKDWAVKITKKIMTWSKLSAKDKLKWATFGKDVEDEQDGKEANDYGEGSSSSPVKKKSSAAKKPAAGGKEKQQKSSASKGKKVEKSSPVPKKRKFMVVSSDSEDA